MNKDKRRNQQTESQIDYLTNLLMHSFIFYDFCCLQLYDFFFCGSILIQQESSLILSFIVKNWFMIK